MLMPGRKFDAGSSYRFGFNGKENDPETYGEGNIYDYGFRIYNPRLGRFLSVDPLTSEYPWYTPYQFAGTSASVVTLASRPVLTTMDALALHLNGDRLDAVHVADAHTASDIVVRWNDADVVALGDIYWSGQYPYIDVESGGSLAGMVAAVEGALARSNARTVVIPGHGPVSNRAELAAYRDMLVAVGRKVREAVETGMGIEDILGTRPTAEFDAKFGRPGAIVAPEEFVRSVYRDLTSQRPGRQER